MIKPNAASDELDSPFFLKNEKNCQEWEKFAKDNNGDIQGSYNSWSYKLFVKIDNPKPWRIIVSRATFTSGNLLLSSKYQSLQDKIEIKTKVDSVGTFIIKKPSFKDFFSGKTMSRLGVNQSYTVLGSTKSKLFDQISDVLSKQFRKKNVFRVELKKKILMITLNDSNKEFELIQTLIDLDLSEE